MIHSDHPTVQPVLKICFYLPYFEKCGRSDDIYENSDPVTVGRPCGSIKFPTKSFIGSSGSAEHVRLRRLKKQIFKDNAIILLS